MKKIKIGKNKITSFLSCLLSLTILTCSLSACTSSKDKNNEIVQEKTNKLVLYGGPFGNNALKAAVKIFESKFPGVDVEYKEFGELGDPEAQINYVETLKYDLSSGSGPDLIFGYDYEFDDFYGMMDSGTFADINTYIENDDTFKSDLYNEAVMNSGLYKGKLCYIPISYNVLSLVSTQEALDYAGFQFDRNTDLSGFSSQMSKFISKNTNSSDELLFSTYQQQMSAFSPWSGVEAIDHENKKILTDSEEFKSSMELYKTYYEMDQRGEEDLCSDTGDGAKLVRNNKALFYYNTLEMSNVLETYSALLDDHTPVLFNFPSANNKTVAEPDYIAAIRKGSPNQANAYELLKILLSEEYQTKHAIDYVDNFSLNIPILKSALKKGIDKWLGFNVGGGTPDGSIKYADLSDEQIQLFVDTFGDIDICIMPNVNARVFTWETMEPYFKGEKSYEDCLKNLNNKLELYINE